VPTRGVYSCDIVLIIMSLEDIAHQVVEFVRAHQGSELPVVAALAFGESLAVISLFLPATVALVGIGALIGASDIAFTPVWISAALGAAFGDWLSYWFGAKFKEPVGKLWPLSHHPDLIPKGEDFVRRWGVGAVFIGRFFGPARAAVPLAAGILAMPYWPFQAANFASAFLWAAVLLAPGTVAMRWLF
jgi:membrane protein DedA with SNARE-associated domain